MSEKKLSEYTHTQAFDHLQVTDGIAMAMIDERNSVMNIINNILILLTELNNTMRRHNPTKDTNGEIIGMPHENLAHEVLKNIKYTSCNFMQYRETIQKRIDSKYWDKLLDASRLTTLMNTNDKESLRELTRTKDAPMFNIESVFATMHDHYTKRYKTFCEGVILLFSELSDGYKSNDKIKLKEKIIFSDAVNGNHWNHYSNARDKIYDLERIFMILDGKDPSDNSYTSSAVQNIENTFQEERYVELEYFTAKTYLKGSLHITFNRKDLVEKINYMIADFRKNSLGTRKSVRN